MDSYIGGENCSTRRREPTDLPQDIYTLCHLFYHVLHGIVLPSLVYEIISLHLRLDFFLKLTFITKGRKWYFHVNW